MKRRSFFTAVAAFLAAPFALFAKPKWRFTAVGDPIDFDYEKDWVEGAARAEKYLAAEEKAAGPWRIVEQMKDGTVVLERAVGGGSVDIEYICCAIDDRKAIMSFCIKPTGEGGCGSYSPIATLEDGEEFSGKW